MLYVYESKMGLLIKMAGSRLGAETLLSQGALGCVAALTALSAHPDIHTGYGRHMDTEFVPSVANRSDYFIDLRYNFCSFVVTTYIFGLSFILVLRYICT